MIKAVLRSGNVYTSHDLKEFLTPVLQWLRARYPKANILVRGDSGFATPDLYDLCDLYGVEFLVKLKANTKLHKYSEELVDRFQEAYGKDFTKQHVMYDDFYYQAQNWSRPLRVECRAEQSVRQANCCQEPLS